jgi:predicted HNH restriction endonuclease
MTLEQKVFERLTETFFAKFKVKNIAIGHCLVSIEDSDERYFQMDVLIREHSRLIITVTPEKHAAELVETLNESSLQKRENFCDIWKMTEGKLKVKINDIERTKEDMLNNNFQWKNFSFRLSVPLYDEAIDQEEKAAELSCTMCSLVLSLVDYSLIGEVEGKETIAEKLHKKRERSPINRQICIQLKGYNCSVCGMNFQKQYGYIGEHFIEIHHSIPVHAMEEGHEVDIKKELFPICSNCHSMIHRKNPPYSIDELRDMMRRKADSTSHSSHVPKNYDIVEKGEILMVAEDIFVYGSIPVDLPKTKREALLGKNLDLVLMYAIGHAGRSKTEANGKLAIGIKEELLKDEQMAAYKNLKYLLFHYWSNPKAYRLTKEPVLVDIDNVPSDFLKRMEKDAVKFLLLEYNPQCPSDLGNIDILKTQRRGEIRYRPFVTTIESIIKE